MSQMFNRLASMVSRHWVLVLVVWAVVVASVHRQAPRWDDVSADGDFAYLPAHMTSVRGGRLLEAAFPEKLAKSQVALVVARGRGQLTEDDLKIADRLAAKYAPREGETGLVLGVWDRHTEILGQRFVSWPSSNGQAALVVLHLASECMAMGNTEFFLALYADLRQLRAEQDYPAGLDVGVTGPAALGADMLLAVETSIKNTEFTTILLVLAILLVVYRAPVLVLVPLGTIALSVLLAEDLVASCAAFAQNAGIDFHIYRTTRICLIVVLYGSGTDYCLFLIARYREELQRGMDRKEAICYALTHVGSALAGSALTTILGLSMMCFADFGKFRSDGPTIAFSLLVTLTACVTLTPAVLRGLGLIVFWPFRVGSLAAPHPEGPDCGANDRVSRLTGLWDLLARAVIARPGLVLVAIILLFAPLAYEGLSTRVSYDLVNELREDCPSVQGLHLLRRYFAVGETGPVTVLAYRPDGRFDTSERQADIARLTKYLYELTFRTSAGLEIRAVRKVYSLTEPLGSPPGTFNPLSQSGRLKIAVLKHPRTKAYFISQSGPYADKLTRLELILHCDPFSRESTEVLDRIEKQLQGLAAHSADWQGTRFDLVGITAAIRDLEIVNNGDQRRISVLVTLMVLAVLLAILRNVVVCLYLILSVLFSYFVTIGFTESFFAWLWGDTFQGLDWKVPVFLFVLLIAIGEDYNIYLVTRVLEEQRRHGSLPGLRRAMVQTGGIITSCGVIMAGTFISMITGTLRAILEWGVSLSFGVLLDTMIVRTILVPAFLALWAKHAARRQQRTYGSLHSYCVSGK